MGPVQLVNLASQMMPHSMVGPGDRGFPLVMDSPPAMPQLQWAGHCPQAADSRRSLLPLPFCPATWGSRLPPKVREDAVHASSRNTSPG